jgi:hypothetical protein
MSSERRTHSWRHWREAVFATCTVWLVLQNVVLFTLVAWGRPANALAAGTAIARTAVTLGGQVFLLVLAASLGLALAAWLVHAPAARRAGAREEASEGRGVHDEH